MKIKIIKKIIFYKLLLIMVLPVSSCTCKDCELPMCEVDNEYRTLMIFVKTTGDQSDDFILNWQTPTIDSEAQTINNFNSKEPEGINCQQNICNLVFHLSGEQIRSPIDEIEIALLKNEQQVANSVVYSLKWDSKKCISYIEGYFTEILSNYSYAEITCEI